MRFENTASRKVSGRSRKGFRKENRKVFYRLQNIASRKVSGRSQKGFQKENRKVFHRVRNTASRKVSGRSRKGFRKLGRKGFVHFSIFFRSSLSRKVLFNLPYVLLGGYPQKVRIRPV